MTFSDVVAILNASLYFGITATRKDNTVTYKFGHFSNRYPFVYVTVSKDMLGLDFPRKKTLMSVVANGENLLSEDRLREFLTHKKTRHVIKKIKYNPCNRKYRNKHL